MENFAPLILTIISTATVSVIYLSFFHKKEIPFAMITFSIFVYLIVNLVSFESNLGLGIGLLGILSLIRLRSSISNLVDISFLFFAITIGLINAANIELNQLLSLNFGLIIILGIGSLVYTKTPNYKTTTIVIDEIITNEKDLISKLEKEHKVEIKELQVVKIDHLKDSMVVNIEYPQ